MNHLRRTRSHPYEGEARYKKLVADIYEFEQRFNIKILPDQARSDATISLFSPEEAEQDLQENGKFNRRNAEVIRKELTRLNRIKPSGDDAQKDDDQEPPSVGDEDKEESDGEENSGNPDAACKDEQANDTETEDDQQIFPEIPKKTGASATFSMGAPGNNKPTMVAFKPPRFLDNAGGQQILSQIKLGGELYDFQPKMHKLFRVEHNARQYQK